MRHIWRQIISVGNKMKANEGGPQLPLVNHIMECRQQHIPPPFCSSTRLFKTTPHSVRGGFLSVLMTDWLAVPLIVEKSTEQRGDNNISPFLSVAMWINGRWCYTISFHFFSFSSNVNCKVLSLVQHCQVCVMASKSWKMMISRIL